MTVLRLILGDQLHLRHSWFKQVDENVLYCLFEMRQETDHVRHHIQKLIGFFAAMRQFASDLQSMGHQVVYYKIHDDSNTHSLTQNLQQLIRDHNVQRLEYQLPDAYRLDTQLQEFCKQLKIESRVYDTEHFYTTRDELEAFFKGKKQFIMESFYRYMRKKHNLLMANGQPEGGAWNYDSTNRKPWKGSPEIPSHIVFNNDATSIIKDLKSANVKSMGHFEGNWFPFPITRQQALEQLKYFCEHLLPHFGDYQDAMNSEQVNLFHSRLSFAMNLKLLTAKNVVDTVINYYRKHTSIVHISQIEGFIRQVIGWREYMRGMYWMLMPDFESMNHLQNNQTLANFFWTGNTRMNCLKQAITNSLDNAYAHHIQRLMVTGNYALLTQTDPSQVDAWYLGVYADAVEWVQLPNTRGMSQFADGGKIATKPYVSSGSYIHKMSNYCQDCFYDPKAKTNEKACPFNSLYWHFLDEKRALLSTNNRMRMMYSILNKMDREELVRLKERAQHIIDHQDAY